MTALPIKFYRDPSECVDDLRRINEQNKRKSERVRMKKASAFGH
jgi:hypothetical protein